MNTVRTGTRCTKNLLKQKEKAKKKENNKMTVNIYDIREGYKAGIYTFKLNEERLYKLPESHIFDEDLSVKRNREMVQEHNARVKDQTDRIRKGEADMDTKLKRDCIKYLIDTYDYISLEIASLIYEKVYADKHDCMYNFFDYLDDAAEFADIMIDMHVHPERYSFKNL